MLCDGVELGAAGAWSLAGEDYSAGKHRLRCDEASERDAWLRAIGRTCGPGPWTVEAQPAAETPADADGTDRSRLEAVAEAAPPCPAQEAEQVQVEDHEAKQSALEVAISAVDDAIAKDPDNMQLLEDLANLHQRHLRTSHELREMADVEPEPELEPEPEREPEPEP
eukprot:COSAG04_NODE_14047_length_583_cov_0.601240_1_plen_166_part_10